MIKTYGYEFEHGKWVKRYELLGSKWLDMRYPQLNEELRASCYRERSRD